MAEANERALSMLAKALEMEERGRKFYETATTNCDNVAGQEIFRMLGRDEVVHTAVIKRIYDKLSAGADWASELSELKGEQDQDDLVRAFVELAAKNVKVIKASADDMKALEVGLEFERKAVAFYLEHLERADDPLEKEFIQAMVEEERTHVSVLADMKTYLENPATWFEEHERVRLDGA